MSLVLLLLFVTIAGTSSTLTSHTPIWENLHVNPPLSNYGAHGYAALGDRFYEFGGLQEDRILSPSQGWVSDSFDVLRYYSYQTNNYTVVSTSGSEPGPRAWPCMTFVGSTLYLFGGITKGFTILTGMWSIDVSQPHPQWRHEAVPSHLSQELPPRLACRMHTWGNKILFGWGIGGPLSIEVLFNDLWSYDPSSSQWVKIVASNPPPPRGMPEVAIYNDHYWIYGGSFSNRPYPNDIWKLNLHRPSRGWKEVHPSLPPPFGRNHQASVLIGSLWHFHGGDRGSCNTDLLIDHTSIYDLRRNRWYNDYLPGYRAGPATSRTKCLRLDNGRVYCTGGYGGVLCSNQQQSYWNTVWSYQPLNSWMGLALLSS